MVKSLRWFCAVLLVVLLWSGWSWADSEPSAPQNPIGGRVVEVSLVGELFLHLDTDGDGVGDIWVKVEGHDSEIVDVDGNPFPPGDITVGTVLLITRYKFEETYYEVLRAVVGEGELSGSGKLEGRIAEAFAFGENTFVHLDVNGDGQGEVAVKVKQTGLITDPTGQALSQDSLQSGVPLSLISYTRDADGFYVTWHVIVGVGAATPNLPLVSGVVVEEHALEGLLFVRLDQDGDGIGELPVRLAPQAQLSDSQGQALTLADVALGTAVEVLGYTFVEGFYDAQQAVISR